MLHETADQDRLVASFGRLPDTLSPIRGAGFSCDFSKVLLAGHAVDQTAHGMSFVTLASKTKRPKPCIPKRRRRPLRNLQTAQWLLEEGECLADDRKL